MMLSVGLTSFVTGITEPIEYSFLFVAPAAVRDPRAAHRRVDGGDAGRWACKDGFSFSAGLIDYVINWSLATKPWLIIPIGAGFAVVYYVALPVRDHASSTSRPRAASPTNWRSRSRTTSPSRPLVRARTPYGKAPGPPVRGPSACHVSAMCRYEQAKLQVPYHPHRATTGLHH